jgi:ribosome-associated protein
LNPQVKVHARRLAIEELNDLIVDSIQDIKGKNIVKLDLRRLEDAPTDFFIICEGDSTTQVKAISDNIQRRLKQEAQVLASHAEGERYAHWICLDYFSTVVHVFYPETRSFYELENLWSDARFTEYESL